MISFLRHLHLCAVMALIFAIPGVARAADDSAIAPPEKGVVDKYVGRKIEKIDVQGLKRIEKEAVLNKIQSKVGEPLSRDTVRADLQAIFSMGFFDDIEVLGESPTPSTVDLTYSVHERPVISKVDFDGNERISTSDLKDVIKVKEWSILDINKVKEDAALIQKHYEDKGFYLAKVGFEVKPVNNDEVELIYKINDYDKVMIKKITFLNNKKYSDEDLKGVFQETKEGSIFSFITNSGSFKESAFKQDLQRLTYWYLDHGFIKFRYENPVVTVSDDKRYLYISIYVDEGEPYKMGAIDFGGDLLFSKEDLLNDLTLKPGDTFGISKRNADIQKLQEKYQDLGYAFVNVIPKMVPHDDTHVVDFEYDFEKGGLVYFNEINIIGNTKTHDKVIRRELKVHEGELYSGSKLRQSRENVERLGYFAPGEVVFNTPIPKGKTDVVNVEIAVKERSTGTITLGAGYGSQTGFFFTAQISEINLFGRGQSVTLQAQYSIDFSNQTLNLGFTEPYTLDTTWSSGGDIYYLNYPIPFKYIAHKVGFDARVGHPVPWMEYTYAYLTYKLEGLQTLYANLVVPPAVLASDQGLLSSVVWSVVRDKRNNRFETSDGNYQSISMETAGIGGDKKFIKGIANNRLYKRVFGDLVLRNSTEVGAIGSFGPAVPSAEKFYLGGPNNMKGFGAFLLSPFVTGFDPGSGQTINTPVGGLYEAFSLFEAEYPIIRDAGIKAVVFFDVGNTWDPAFTNFGGIRADVGFGIRWFSPIGPLRFEWGFPINPQPGEQNPAFQFFIGPPF